MIPILYEKTETAFISNGLGRLRDCISCVVTEERNGIYECDFEYPLDGAHFDEIQLGRIIGVTHDDSDDIQPFDIVSYSKPIDEVVTFHCTHISYRQSYLTVSGTGINSLSDAFTRLTNNSTPSNPFTYQTDKSSVGYVGAFDGIPKSVRQILGGIEGSILDTYGGEYEWDRFRVILHSARGQYRNFSIRYGVNMLDYNEETDIQGCYSSVIPYWTDGTQSIVGDVQTNGSTVTNRSECIPLDVSDKFETMPTKAQVDAMGLSVLQSSNSTLPTQNIHVEFVRLQDMGEYESFSNLLRCQLCDTIKVIFPDFSSSGMFKIVKTVWDVLMNRYESMELGDLSISLSEALGISDVQKDSKATIEQIEDRLTKHLFHMPFGSWHYGNSTAVSNSNISDTGAWHYPGNFTGGSFSHADMDYGYGYWSADNNGFYIKKKGVYRLTAITHMNDYTGACSHAVRFYNYTDSAQIGAAQFNSNTVGYASVQNQFVGVIDANKTIALQVERYSTGEAGSKWKLSDAYFFIELIQDLEEYDPAE